jgi:uncharacterized surface protein with fasciclin (FAS1) repeats
MASVESIFLGIAKKKATRLSVGLALSRCQKISQSGDRRMIRKQLFIFGAGALLGLGLTTTQARAGDCGTSKQGKDIVETAIEAGSFKTLVTAVQAAGLVETLRSPGPFTVLAPTDEAFAKLPATTLSQLLEQPDRLAAILKYHVLTGRVMAEDVASLTSARTVLGQSVRIDTSCGVKFNDAKVLTADIGTSNGVIHVIDTVLIPQSDIIETARSAGSFHTLLAALEAADLTDALRADGPFTVFAPTDEAFAKLPEGTIEGLLKDKEKLQAILTYHVVPGKVLAKDVTKLASAETLQGQKVRIGQRGAVTVDNARVLTTDVAATNGVIHVIDTVLLPS